MWPSDNHSTVRRGGQAASCAVLYPLFYDIEFAESSVSAAQTPRGSTLRYHGSSPVVRVGRSSRLVVRTLLSDHLIPPAAVRAKRSARRAAALARLPGAGWDSAGRPEQPEPPCVCASQAEARQNPSSASPCWEFRSLSKAWLRIWRIRSLVTPRSPPICSSVISPPSSRP